MRNTPIPDADPPGPLADVTPPGMRVTDPGRDESPRTVPANSKQLINANDGAAVGRVRPQG